MNMIFPKKTVKNSVSIVLSKATVKYLLNFNGIVVNARSGVLIRVDLSTSIHLYVTSPICMYTLRHTHPYC